MATFITFLNRIIEYSFYALFLFVPIVFVSDTSELFEFNKMWLTYILTIVIGFCWISKMIVQKKIVFQRTLFDIPILLFLLSQFLSTLFSLDPHVSFWGYYSRFNGGLLSWICYIVLYYAFVSNLFEKRVVKHLLIVSLISGGIVGFWGLPSHYGHDPTCFLIRGTFDVSCWTDAFQPRVRIFSTLGQPTWLAAYMAVLIPLALAFLFKSLPQWNQISRVLRFWKPFLYVLLIALFYLDLLLTRARSGFIGIAMALVVFFVGFVFLQKGVLRRTISIHKLARSFAVLIVVGIIVCIVTFFEGTELPYVQNFTYKHVLTPSTESHEAEQKTQSIQTQIPQLESGGTESGDIRKIVWKGALDIFTHYPVFGSGVETYAFAYYKHRPIEHNLTSEWDYLYNKAHNEYLNFLATTGAFGLGAYLLMIAAFLFVSVKYIHSRFEHSNISKDFELRMLSLGLLASYTSILFSNFFGFSVVIINLYMICIPAFMLVLSSEQKAPLKESATEKHSAIAPSQWIMISSIGGLGIYIIIILMQYWQADRAYALGYNLDRVSEYQTAYAHLQEAIQKRPGEPVFQDEFALNSSVLSLLAANQKNEQLATSLAQQAIQVSNTVVSEHPQNVVFWKTRTRIFYSLSQLNSQYLTLALEAIKQAHELAPTDAKISYNLGVLYGQTGDTQKAVEVLENTTKLKPNYRDAYYALGLYYRSLAVDAKDHVIKPDMQQKASGALRYILLHLNQKEKPTIETLKSWGVIVQ